MSETRGPLQQRPAPPGPLGDREGWMMFHHSGALRITTLRAKDVDIRDIVHPLGQINRYNGQSNRPVSVLAHSLLVAELCAGRQSPVVLEALMHDAGEAYVGDWIRPLRTSWGRRLSAVRRHVQRECFAAAGVRRKSDKHSQAVQWADDLALRHEMTSKEGYQRVATWHQPLRDDEQRATTAAVVQLAQRGCALDDPESCERELLRHLDALVAGDAPLRRSLDEAVAELNARTTTTPADAAPVSHTLTVVLADTHATYMSLIHNQEQRPYRRRTVRIELTAKQRRLLTPRETGQIRTGPVYEEQLECWLEPPNSRPSQRGEHTMNRDLLESLRAELRDLPASELIGDTDGTPTCRTNDIGGDYFRRAEKMTLKTLAMTTAMATDQFNMLIGAGCTERGDQVKGMPGMLVTLAPNAARDVLRGQLAKHKSCTMADMAIALTGLTGIDDARGHILVLGPNWAGGMCAWITPEEAA